MNNDWIEHNNDWIEHKMYVLNNLNELKDDTKTIKNELSTLKYTFTVFQTKVITTAMIGSGILSIIITIIPMIFGGK